MTMVAPNITQDVLARLIDGMQGREFSRDSWRAHLVAIKALTEALIADVDADAQPVLPNACPHTEVETAGTFGNVETRCVACHAQV